jgi:hypothetical protein
MNNGVKLRYKGKVDIITRDGLFHVSGDWEDEFPDAEKRLLIWKGQVYDYIPIHDVKSIDYEPDYPKELQQNEDTLFT